MGIDLQENWQDNKTFNVTTDHGTKLRIEDEYQENNTHRKEKLVREALKLAFENPNDEVLHIIYNSIAFHGIHTPYMYAWGGVGIKPSMNESLKSYLRSNPGKKRFGVIMLDFYNDDRGNDSFIVDSIIKSNFCTDG
jgi:1-phosphatidylinositol phosphodiesterase